ncbi:hypothetical protein CA267_005130 [Alteromonas pelagimontana]|uniref:Uncharacterized protein n=1 Tax=Alteromonas pelagimontana TaxID=1858656 RepID=A0A6M4MAH3_9ALTE|nr:hypothetical protein [Alteromonas pelagimontana]QJR80201.1 hypothetical protein CA267_005130 [Alteromonas pelagimontana]
MKPLILVTLMGLSTVAHAAGRYPELNKELEIMTGVIDTALKQSVEKQSIGYRSLESLYLAGQGVVFTVNTHSGGMGVNFNLSDILGNISAAPMPPIPAFNSGNMEFEVDSEWEDIAEDAVRRVEEAFRETNEEIRDLREQEREIAWEKRDLERRKRDLEFEMRQVNGKRVKDLERELKELNTEMQTLATREKKLATYAEQMEKEQQNRVDKQKEAQEKMVKQFLANFESSVGNALCRFGGGMRELKDNENINFVLKNFFRGDNREYSDRIYVFTKANIHKCVQEKISSSDLLSTASVYQF